MLAAYLRHVNEDQTNWDEWVPSATYVYNTTVHSATGITPFELFGHPAVMYATFGNYLVFFGKEWNVPILFNFS